ncbi:hypothetical protein Enr13x_21620 [Stieleria neptunia]|uniref:DUF1552 domain-containing protein n=1 Tax=Stieleria neptunia TaxID=2527979 RepID=A0A518HNG3_9BACT|nr:DUF1552 domain-containing protein [Stieleria neptunia]QDV42317.1 hypothetical protein Enr13x_21620 [Stieleria neptunia]
MRRRHFLRSSSALITLPFLESLGFQRFASAAPVVAPPKRMIFLGFGWGVTRESWFPDVATTGADYDLPKGLAPLQRHKKDFSIIQGLENQFSNEAHWGSTFYLTGANRYAVPGQSFSNSISADQVAAEQLGTDTRYTSVQLCGADNDGHGPGQSLAWNRQGKPVAGWNNPVVAFHRLFSDDSTPLEQRQAMLKQRRSVLDAVLIEARSVRRGLSKTDTEKLSEYFQSIRDIETRIAKEEQWLDVPKKQAAHPIDEPRGEIEGYQEVKVMYDLLVAALQVDATRVITYRQPGGTTFLQSLGATLSGHNMSHYAPGMRQEVSELRDRKQSELLAGLIDKLKATKEADGTSLFDHVSLSYGSNINSIHYLTNCPTLVAGGGAGIKLGQHLVKADGTPLCNLWLTLLQGIGLDVPSHGDSQGVIKELVNA